MQLAKIGYYNGDPEKILEAPVNIVISLLNYEAFERDYEIAYNAINKPEVAQ